MRGGKLYDWEVIEIPARGKRRSKVDDRTSGEKRDEEVIGVESKSSAIGVPRVVA
jgi:hypothetical protein